MKKIIKKIQKFLKSFKKLFKWLCINIIYHKKNSIIKIEDKRILIIGNGPSASSIKIQSFIEKDFQILCVNFYACTDNFFIVKPKYYCLLDNAFYNAFSLPECERDEQINKLINNLEKITWDIYLIRLNGKMHFKNKYIHEIIISGNELNDSFKKIQIHLYNKNKATYGYQNVILGAIFAMLVGNTSEIALIGVENDWHRELSVDINNNVWRDDKHFYGERKINLTESGEIEKNYLFKYFYYYYITLRNYFYASEYAKAKNIKITNLTEDSFIDTFNKKNWNEYLDSLKKEKSNE